MELKGRLKLIADKVPKCTIVNDIGTDHAFIPVYLVKKGVCKKAIAVDVRQGPLLAASDNIKHFKLQEVIETRLGDGLEPISIEEADVIVIAGMGGILIKDILGREMDKAKAANTLVLQPMNSIEILREWLYEKGFIIYDEELVDEGEKVYNVINAKWSGSMEPHEVIDYFIGPLLVKKKDQLLRRILNKKVVLIEGILNDLGNTCEDNSKTLEKYKYLIEKYKEILKRL